MVLYKCASRSTFQTTNERPFLIVVNRSVCNIGLQKDGPRSKSIQTAYIEFCLAVFFFSSSLFCENGYGFILALHMLGKVHIPSITLDKCQNVFIYLPFCLLCLHFFSHSALLWSNNTRKPIV